MSSPAVTSLDRKRQRRERGLQRRPLVKAEEPNKYAAERIVLEGRRVLVGDDVALADHADGRIRVAPIGKGFFGFSRSRSITRHKRIVS
jgi:hypothetical protein